MKFEEAIEGKLLEMTESVVVQMQMVEMILMMPPVKVASCRP